MQKKSDENYKILLTMIQAYKYNGWLYHTWQPLYVIDSNADYLFCASKALYVLTSKKNSTTCFKHCQEGCYTCWFFFKKEWFNIKITIDLEENKIVYYINIASPFLVENGVIKYIDFDIDFKCIKKINEDEIVWKELDTKEYYDNKRKYHYPSIILKIIENSKERIKKLNKLNYFTNNYSYERLIKFLNGIDFTFLEPSIINEKNE